MSRNVFLKMIFIGLSIFSNQNLNAGLMKEEINSPIPQEWTAIEQSALGLTVSFPYPPFEMSADFPFQNTPPSGKLQWFSTPTSKGLLSLALFSSPSVNQELLQKKSFHSFFEKIVAPYCFFDPTLFENQQTYHHQITQFKGSLSTSFQLTFKEDDKTQKIKGMATIKENTLIIAFYIASDSYFDEEL